MKEKRDETMSAFQNKISISDSVGPREIFSQFYSTNLRHLLTLIHEVCSLKAARRTFGPQILTRMLVLMVMGFRQRGVREENDRFLARVSLSGEKKESRASEESKRAA